MLYLLMNRLVHSRTLTVDIGESWIIDVCGNIRIGDWIYCYMTVARTRQREDCGREQIFKNNNYQLFLRTQKVLIHDNESLTWVAEQRRIL